MRVFAALLLALAGTAPSPASAQFDSDNALRFDGVDDRVHVSSLPPFINDLSRDFTVAFWLRLDAATGRVFFAQRDLANFATVLASNGSLLFYVRSENVTYATRADNLQTGTWSHVAVRWRAASRTPEIVLDGVLQPTIAGGSSSTGVSGVMTLGSRTDGAQPLGGALDDFVVWPELRSLEQIRVERSSICRHPDAAQLRYDFDVGTPSGDNSGATRLPDATGGGLPGTLSGFDLNGTASNWVASERPRVTPGLVFDPPLPEVLATSESGAGYTGSVRLTVQPLEAVTLSLQTDAQDESIATPASLVFTPENWDVPQPVTVLGVADAVLDGDAAFTFEARLASLDPCQNARTLTRAGHNQDLDSGDVSIVPALRAEGDSGASLLGVPVTYSGAAVVGGFQLGFATVEGSALAGIDFVATEGTLVFDGSPGQTRFAHVPVLGNRRAQGDRQFSVQLGAVSRSRITLGTGSAQAVIIDDDLDLQVTLDNGVEQVDPGQSVAYDLIVRNLSPTLDAGTVPVSFSAVPFLDLVWSCAPSGGAACAGGAGVFADLALLPAGSQARYTVTGLVPATFDQPGMPRNLIATARALLAIDSQPGDNQSIDVDTGRRIFVDGFE